MKGDGGDYSKFPSASGLGSFASLGLPTRGFSALAPENDLSALVNANLALAQQNLEMSGRHTGSPDYNGIRLSSGYSPTIAGSNSSLPGGRLGSLPSPSDLLAGSHLKHSSMNRTGASERGNEGGGKNDMPAMYGNTSAKRDRGPSSAFFGTSFGVAGSFGSIFPHDMLGTSPSDRNGNKNSNKVDYYDDLNAGTSPNSTKGDRYNSNKSGGGTQRGFGGRGTKINDEDDSMHGGSGFKIGSIGYMRDLDDALPLVGSLELGSPDLAGMMNSIPQRRRDKNLSKSSNDNISMRTSPRKSGTSHRTSRDESEELDNDKKSNGGGGGGGGRSTRGSRGSGSRKESPKDPMNDPSSETFDALSALVHSSRK
jgi:hypothetical protein